MSSHFRVTLAIVGILCAIATNASTIAQARDYALGDLRIQQPWARATPKGAPTGGGYMTIRNAGSKADRLLGGKTAAAARLEIHKMSMSGGIMRMRQLPDGVELPPGAAVEFKPGAIHLMLVQLTAPLKHGDRVPVTLTFERAGSIELELDVQPIGANMPVNLGSPNHAN